MHPRIAIPLFILTTAYFVLVFAQHNYTPDPYSNSQSRYGTNNSQDPYYNQPYNNDQQRFNSQDRYNQDRFNQDRYNQDRYNNPDRYNQDRYNSQDRYGNQDRYNSQDRYNNPDRYNQDRFNTQDRYNNQDRYNQDRSNQDRYNSGQQYGGNQQPPYNRQYGQSQPGQGNYDTRFGPTGGGGGYVSGDDGNCCEDFCYRRSEPYLQFATKTAYQFAVRQQIRNDQFKVPQCEPILFWSLNRHGAQLPDHMLIPRLRNLENIRQQIIMNYDQRQSYPRIGRMCEDDMDLFKRWRWNDSITEQRAMSLTTQGADDLRILARKLQSGFSPLLDQPYNEQYYKFQYSEADKSHDSYQAFIEGLFPNSAYRVHAEVLQQDRMYSGGGSANNYYSPGGSSNYNNNYNRPSSPYSSQSSYSSSSSYSNSYSSSSGYSSGYSSSCNTWQPESDDNPQMLMEYYKFRQRPEYRDLVRDVSRRLGFKYNLNETVVDDMYEMCRYEKSWYPRDPSAWCAAFSERQLKILEYAEDLKYYYKNGYGNDMNTRIGCQPLKDMRDRFERQTNSYGSESEKVVVYFSHLTTMQLLLVSLGAARDFTPLTAENYVSQSRRHWRTSNITPLTANLVAVLFKCNQGDPHKVMFFLNESPLDIPGCQVGLCNWNVFKEKADQAIRNCNLDYCGNGAKNKQTGLIMIVLSVLSLFVYYKFNE